MYWIKNVLLLSILLASTVQAEANFQCKKKINITEFERQLSLIEIWDDNYWQTLASDAEISDLRSSHHDSFFQQCLKDQLSISKLSALTTLDLTRVANVVSDNSFYANDVGSTLTFKKIIDEMIKRKLAVTELQISLVSRYIKHRQFTLANQVINQNKLKGQSLLPEITNISNGQRPLLSINPAYTSFKQHDFKFSLGTHIIVVSSPMCNPSKRFLTWLNGQPKLRKIFNHHSTWINPASSSLHLDIIEQRNVINKHIPLHYVKKESDWPEISYWGTPTFYFYVNGQRVKQMVGWPHEGKEQELRAVLKELTFL